MLRAAKTMFQRLREWPKGRRFRHFHREYGGRHHGFRKALLILGAFVCFVIGVVLAFIPGPAWVFFGLTAGFLAALSGKVARWFDAVEVRGWRLWLRYQRRRARRRLDRRPPTGDSVASHGTR